jgi:hypothetical protein
MAKVASFLPEVVSFDFIAKVEMLAKRLRDDEALEMQTMISLSLPFPRK